MRARACAVGLCCAFLGASPTLAIVPLSPPSPETRAVDVAPGMEAVRDMVISGFPFLNPPTKESLAAAQASLERAQADLDEARQRVKAGLAPESTLRSYEDDLAQKQRVYDQMKTGYEARQRAESLNRMVDVQLQNAPIRQVAEALSRASGLKIAVDPSVPQDTRVSVDARHVPLASVLEAVANQTNLVIAPREGGAILERWPSLKVNGSGTHVSLRNPPWTDAWGLFPPTSPLVSGLPMSGMMGIFGGGSGGIGGGGGAISIPHPGTGAGTRSMAVLERGGAAGVSIASVGNHVVVAEPGTDDQGNAGVWLTVYALNGDKLEKVSATFQKSQPGG